MADARGWMAALYMGSGVPPVWVEVGQAHDDGLVIIDDLPQTGPLTPWRGGVWIFDRDRRTGRTRAYGNDGTARSRRLLIKAVARFDRDALAIRWPAASRVKRAYHQRRR